MVRMKSVKRMFPTVPVKRTKPVLGMSETDNIEETTEEKEEPCTK